MITRSQMAAFHAAARWIADHDRTLTMTVYATETSPDGLGQTREYYVDHLPPIGIEVVQVWEVAYDPAKGNKGYSHPYTATEIFPVTKDTLVTKEVKAP